MSETVQDREVMQVYEERIAGLKADSRCLRCRDVGAEFDEFDAAFQRVASIYGGSPSLRAALEPILIAEQLLFVPGALVHHIRFDCGEVLNVLPSGMHRVRFFGRGAVELVWAFDLSPLEGLLEAGSAGDAQEIYRRPANLSAEISLELEPESRTEGATP